MNYKTLLACTAASFLLWWIVQQPAGVPHLVSGVAHVISAVADGLSRALGK